MIFKIKINMFCDPLFSTLLFVFSLQFHLRRSLSFEYQTSTIKNELNSLENHSQHDLQYTHSLHLIKDSQNIKSSTGEIVLRRNHCDDRQFQCKNGQCIDKSFLCDGLLDCRDKSDETFVQCQYKSCDKQHFQCQYGACIDAKYKCDGHKQCWDGSDESSDTCNAINSEPINTRRRRQANKPCAVASSPMHDKTISYTCPSYIPTSNCTTQKEYVFESTVATVTCAPGYHLEDPENDQHFCSSSGWIPKMKSCLRECEKLNATNVDLIYNRNGLNVPNKEGHSVILAGTKVRQSCKPGYKFESTPYFSENTCGNDGRWDRNLVPCIPECGVTNDDIGTTILGGVEERVGGSPWHAAIFNNQKLLICGGTIISEHVILSAAHCFGENGDCEGTRCANDFEIIVGKTTNNYSARDNDYQNTHKIKEIRFSPRYGFHGQINFYGADIAILILREKIIFSGAVLPACINWLELKNDIYPSEGVSGKVSGWGAYENNTQSEVIRTVNLPYIGNKNCLEMMHDDFKSFLTTDKFCAGSGNRTGPITLQGDSGGGILFQKRGLFYLRGIVSVKQYSSNAAALFTDIGKYAIWIESVRNEVEISEIRHKVEKEPVKKIATSTTSPLNQNNTPPAKGDHVSQSSTSTIPNRIPNSDNSIFQKLKGQNSEFGQYPRIVAITAVLLIANKTSNVWLGTGSLLTPSVVLTSDHFQFFKDVDRMKLRIRLYKYDTNGDTNTTEPSYQERTAKQIRKQSQSHLFDRRMIMILLNEPFYSLELVTINPYSTSNSYDPNSCSVLMLDNAAEDGKAKFPQKLRKIDVKVLPTNQCEDKLKKTSLGPSFKLDPIFICDSEINVEVGPCADFAGAPLVCALKSHPSTFVQVGLVFSGQGCGRVPLQNGTWNNARNVNYYNHSESPDNHVPLLYVSLQANKGWFWEKLADLTSFAAKIAELKCKEYGEYRYASEWRNFTIVKEMDCVNAIPLIAGGVQTEPKEYPHMVLLGYGKEIENVVWGYGGILISEKFVLSGRVQIDPDVEFSGFWANIWVVLVSGPPEWVALGDIYTKSTIDSTKKVIHKIVKRYTHPTIETSSFFHDISLFELGYRAVEMSPYIRPACLYTSTSLPSVGTKATIAGFSYRVQESGEKKNELLKATVSIFRDKLCEVFYEDDTQQLEERFRYDSATMICAGNFVEGREPRRGDLGGPLQIPVHKEVCMWSVLGIVSVSDRGRPGVYTKVPYYLDWIQSIVWPQ